MSALAELHPRRALVVVAHPDDESWLFGGSIATWSRSAAVRVLCVTDGGGGGDRRGVAQGELAVAEVRRHELAAACAALGAELARLDLPDGGLVTFPVERGQAVIHEQIKAFAPDCVVTHGPDGEYGHLDHLAVHEWVRSVWPDPWVPALPVGRMQPVWRRLRKAGFGSVRKGMAPGDFGADPGAIVRLDAAAAQAKRTALACHASQLRGGDLDSFLAPGLVSELLTEERLVRATQWR